MIGMKKFIFVLLYSLSLAVGCRPTEIPFEPHKPPELLWKHPLTQALGLANTIPPRVANGVVAYTHKRIGDPPQSPLMGLNAETGQLTWRWDDLHQDSRSGNSTSTIHTFDGIMIYSTKGPVYGIDLQTGSTKWKELRFSKGTTYNSGYDNMVFHVFKEFPDNGLGNVHLGLANVEEGNWRLAYSLTGDSLWRPDIITFDGTISPEGDTLLYMTGSWYQPAISFSKGFLLGYNLTADSLLFQHENDGDYVYGMLNLYQDRLLASGTNLRCYQTETGELLWEKKLHNGYLSSNPVWTSGPVIAGDQVLVNISGISPRLFLFNIDNGQQVWRSEEIQTDSHLLVHQNTIYATGGRELKAINLSDGQLLWSIPSPHAQEHDGAFFSPALGIDRENNRLYASDYLYALCYEL